MYLKTLCLNFDRLRICGTCLKYLWSIIYFSFPYLASTTEIMPPRGLNSPRTIAHRGLTALTKSFNMRFTAFS